MILAIGVSRGKKSSGELQIKDVITEVEQARRRRRGVIEPGRLGRCSRDRREDRP